MYRYNNEYYRHSFLYKIFPLRSLTSDSIYPSFETVSKFSNVQALEEQASDYEDPHEEMEAILKV